MSHTPTPWKLINEKTIVGLDHPRQGYVADVNLHRSNDQQEPDGDANAAHIVRCVNSHDALIEALRTIKNQSLGPDWTAEQALDFIKQHAKEALKAAEA